MDSVLYVAFLLFFFVCECVLVCGCVCHTILCVGSGPCSLYVIDTIITSQGQSLIDSIMLAFPP